MPITTLEEASERRCAKLLPGYEEYSYEHELCGPVTISYPRKCSRPNGHGPSGLYCWQHDPMRKKDGRGN